MSLEELNKVVESSVLPINVAERYLNLYIGESEWEKHINKLWVNLEKNKLKR
jgi:hypothetical protein